MNAQVQESLVSAEMKLSEAKKQYDLMLEGKKLELSKHLKDLSQKNDQVLLLNGFIFSILLWYSPLNDQVGRQSVISGRSMRWKSWMLLWLKRRRCVLSLS